MAAEGGPTNKWLKVAVGALVLLMPFALDWWDPLDAECQMDGVRCERQGNGWLLEGRDFTGDVSLVVRSGEFVILRDVHVQAATHVSLYVDCGCKLLGEDFTIDAVPHGANVWLSGDWRDPRPLEVALEGLTIKNVDRLGTDAAFRSVRLGNITLECAPGGGGIDLRGDVPIQSYALHDVRSEGCSSLSFGRREPGPPAELRLERVHLNGTGLDDGNNDGIRKTADANYDLVLVDSTVRNARYALNVGEGDSLTLIGSTVAGSVTGISVGEGARRVVIEDSTISENLAGIRVWGDSELEINGSSFLANGRRPFGPEAECGGAITGRFTGFVHGSIFQGNTIAVEGGAGSVGLFDAPGNYWGSGSGPTPQALVTPVCLPTSPAGDQVGIGVNFVPFLTAPPS